MRRSWCKERGNKMFSKDKDREKEGKIEMGRSTEKIQGRQYVAEETERRSRRGINMIEKLEERDKALQKKEWETKIRDSRYKIYKDIKVK